MPALRAKSLALTGYLARAARAARAGGRDPHARRARRSAAASCRCASRGGASRGKQVFAALGGARHGGRLARARHHPRRPGAALQRLRGRLALRAGARGGCCARERAAARVLNIVGAGLVGALMALMLARRGLNGDADRAPCRSAPDAGPNAAAPSTWRSPRAALRRSRRPASWARCSRC